ncbi:hypothetical protein HY523_00295 [Candidatus Berkelbacteria bacterium]|nr:hypothetical protein [Candidatus Berkelbacteria bacterium]
MAQSADRGADLHFRLFAKLLMFITLFLGIAIGYAGGFVMGQQNALALIYQGQQAADTMVADDIDAMSAAMVACYKEVLGSARYAQMQAGYALTTNESLQVQDCAELK